MKNNEDLVNSFVEIDAPNDDKFLVIRETLTRIGVASRHEKKLFQSVHILQKRGKYYLVHFKELFALDGRDTDISENDIARRNTIANLLHEWDLVKIKDLSKIENPTVPSSQLKIIPFNEKSKWELCPKYTIGKK